MSIDPAFFELTAGVFERILQKEKNVVVGLKQKICGLGNILFGDAFLALLILIVDFLLGHCCKAISKKFPAEAFDAVD